jgi:uncharacterized membrane protein SirB2
VQVNAVAAIPSWYPTIKYIHVALALLSLGGFVFRGVLMLRDSAGLSQPLVRRLPHINDTLLLSLGVLLLWRGPWSLATAGWLQLKLTLLLFYIGLGFIALHRGHFTRGQRLLAWVSAVSVFICMLGLAHYKPL